MNEGERFWVTLCPPWLSGQMKKLGMVWKNVSNHLNYETPINTPVYRTHITCHFFFHNVQSAAILELPSWISRFFTTIKLKLLTNDEALLKNPKNTKITEFKVIVVNKNTENKVCKNTPVKLRFPWLH